MLENNIAFAEKKESPRTVGTVLYRNHMAIGFSQSIHQNFYLPVMPHAAAKMLVDHYNFNRRQFEETADFIGKNIFLRIDLLAVVFFQGQWYKMPLTAQTSERHAIIGCYSYYITFVCKPKRLLQPLLTVFVGFGNLFIKECCIGQQFEAFELFYFPTVSHQQRHQ